MSLAVVIGATAAAVFFCSHQSRVEERRERSRRAQEKETRRSTTRLHKVLDDIDRRRRLRAEFSESEKQRVSRRDVALVDQRDDDVA